MLYNYYMKKYFTWLCAALFIVCSSVYSFAQLTVVRVDGTKIYLDTSDQAVPPAVGSSFKIILSSEKLTNPNTGKDLGELYNYSETGTIREVQPLYAIGELKNTSGVTVGKTAVLEEKPQTILPQETTEPETKTTPKNIRPFTTFQPIEQTIIGITQADVTGPGADNIITLSDKNQVTVFTRGEKNTLIPALQFNLPTGKKGLSISAAPLKQGNAQIFVSVYNEGRGNISTLILENKENALENTDSLPLFTKELGCGTNKQIWGQRGFVLGNTPGNAREILFEKKKFVVTGATFNTRHNWLQGINYFPIEKTDAENLIATASNGTLRLFLANGKRVQSKDLFGSTPLRVQHKQEILKFYPSLQVFGKPAQVSLAAVENDTKLGLLTETFGQYQNGKVHFLTYQNGSLKITDTVELEGVLYDTACTDRAILTAAVLPDGNSTVVEILK